jgi:hypothetical protein
MFFYFENIFLDELDFAPSVKNGFWTTYYLDGFEKVILTTICA